MPRKYIEAKASGINHFTFFTEFRDRRTGEDLLPRIRAFFAKPCSTTRPGPSGRAKVLDRRCPVPTFLEFNYSPLVVHMVREYGLVPCSVDSHIGEYVPFALDVAEWQPTPLDFHEPIMVFLERAATWAANTKVPLPLHPAATARGGRAIIAAHVDRHPDLDHGHQRAQPGLPARRRRRRHRRGRRDRRRQRHPPRPDAARWRTARRLDQHPDPPQDLVVEAAITGDPDLALQAVVEDPCSPPDEAACRAMFDELRALQAAHLPF